jgi:2-polyprenyl-6-methoxyphenol hydroxylase-like FAD-dependent oxidoreductase
MLRANQAPIVLTVAGDRLGKWGRPRLLRIADVAPAKSPRGWIGLNIAVQDAIAAANILAEALRGGRLAIEHLAQVPKRRTLLVKLTQRMQVFVQRNMIGKLLDRDTPIKAPGGSSFATAARGIGVRAEHSGHSRGRWPAVETSGLAES